MVHLDFTSYTYRTESIQLQANVFLRAPSPSSLVYKPLLAGADASLWDLVQYFVLLIEMCAVWSL